MHKHSDIFKKLRSEYVTYKDIAKACGTSDVRVCVWNTGYVRGGKKYPPTGIPFDKINNVIALADERGVKGVDIDAFWRAEVEHINKMFRDLKESL